MQINEMNNGDSRCTWMHPDAPGWTRLNSIVPSRPGIWFGPSWTLMDPDGFSWTLYKHSTLPLVFCALDILSRAYSIPMYSANDNLRRRKVLRLMNSDMRADIFG